MPLKQMNDLTSTSPGIQISDKEGPFVAHVVVLANPEDCERIARLHIKKQPIFTPFYFQSLIATTDNSHWRSQRSHLAGANCGFVTRPSLSCVAVTLAY
jgi:hypothetical protein